MTLERALVVLMAWALAGLLAAPARAQAAPEATLRLLNRDVVTLRASLAGATPEQRVQRALERLRTIPDDDIDQPLKALPFTLGSDRGMQIMLGNWLLFTLLEGDLAQEGPRELEPLVRQTLERLTEVRQAWHASLDTQLLWRGIGHTVAATLLLALLTWSVARGQRRLLRHIEDRRNSLANSQRMVRTREWVLRVASGLSGLLKWLLIAVLGYLWLRHVLASFLLTAPLSRELGAWLGGRLAWLGDGVVNATPGLLTVLIVLLLTRVVVDLLGYFFDAIQQGRLELPFLHIETISATRRIVSFVTWALGVAVAYPYLPGSSSDAFKGISVLMGLMLTLGSTGLATQVMSGLVVIYARAVRKGDFIEVNGLQGVVTEVAPLATKLINVRNQEVTVPNSVLIAGPIFNHSRRSEGRGVQMPVTVTIGYDAPWRQVHELLTQAARATPGLSPDAPRVYQRALSDFYVEYELVVWLADPLQRLRVSTELHGRIQDAFNEAGVQIMSPHFMAQPGQPVLGARGTDQVRPHA